MIPFAFLPIGNHLWQSTLFAAAAGLLTLAFRQHRAAVRHGLWMAASVKFLLPFSLLTAAAARFAPVHAVAAPAKILPVIDQFARPFVPGAQLAAAPSPAAFSWTTLLFAIWLCGFAVNAIGWLRQWLRVRAAYRAARPMAMEAPIRVLATPARMEPGIVGVWRPVLLLPEGIGERLSARQIDAILIHELCHVRRRDNLMAAIHMVVEALFWFHPLVWWIETRLVEERERACDEEVLRRCGDAESYAEGILGVCKLYVRAPACVSGVGGSNLRRRVEAIMAGGWGRSLTGGRKLLLAVAGLAAVAIPALVGIWEAPYLRAQSGKRESFEVISIKPNTDHNERGFGSWQLEPGGRFHAKAALLWILIADAYNVPFQGERLKGLPEVAGTRYDIDAVPAPGTIPPGLAGKALDARIRPLLQSMLEDRFHLVMRRETKELPLYAIVRGKGGLKLKRSKIQEAACGTEGAECHGIHGGMGRGIHGTALDLDDVALFVSNWTDKPVINRTGLSDLFEIDTDGWVPMQPRQPREDGGPDPEAAILNDPTRHTIFEIFDRLGLKLEATKGPLDMYVVEHLERPTAN